MLKVMTRREWIEQNHPELLNECYSGGVCGCPDQFKELGYEEGECNEYGYATGYKGEHCTLCWGKNIGVDVPAPNARCSIWSFIKEVFGRV